MENNNIILFILVICVIYLLYCNRKKEQFTSTSTNVHKQDQTDDNPLDETKDSTSITESIENLSEFVKTLLDVKSHFKFHNLNVFGNFNVLSDNSMLPAGTIVMFTKGIEKIPDGWVACDGKNDTPDLRGRFVLGAGEGTDLTNRSLGDNSGEETHKLTESEMPEHNHHISKDHSAKTAFIGPILVGGGGDWKVDAEYDYSQYPAKWQAGWVSSWVNTNTEGEDVPHNNMPPYYVLIYIMKVYIK